MGILTSIFNQAAAQLKAAKPTDLILFTLRHGESLGQIDPGTYKSIGDEYLPLTPLGVAQAADAGSVISTLAQDVGIPEFHLYTSLGERSLRTAREIFNVVKQSQELSLKPDHRLDKQKFGEFDGLFTSAERKAYCPKLFQAYIEQRTRDGEFKARPPGGESVADVQDRIYTLLAELVKNPIPPSVIVTHGTNTLCIENALLGHSEKWVLQNIDTRPNCSIQLLTGNYKNGFKSLMLNNHLSEAVARQIRSKPDRVPIRGL